MVDYSWPRVQYEKIVKYRIFKNKLEFYIDPGGPGGHLGGSRTDSGAEKQKKLRIF